MAQILYAMQFTGQASPVNEAGTVLKAATTAPSCSITTTVGAQGVSGMVQPLAGEQAAFESTVTFMDASSFQESGSIDFGSGEHRLRFSTVGQDCLGASADAKLKHGTVMWRVEGGEGQFAGASGLITSNFFVGDGGEVTDNHFGALFVP
jgi:hypothetical protein